MADQPLFDETPSAAVAAWAEGGELVAVGDHHVWCKRLPARRVTDRPPLLVLHGDQDQNVPLAASSQRLPGIVDGARLHIVEGGPHGLNISHQQEWEEVLLEFLASL